MFAIVEYLQRLIAKGAGDEENLEVAAQCLRCARVMVSAPAARSAVAACAAPPWGKLVLESIKLTRCRRPVARDAAPQRPQRGVRDRPR